MATKTTKRFHYTCSKGHGNSAPWRLEQCNCFVHGVRCDGTLKSVR